MVWVAVVCRCLPLRNAVLFSLRLSCEGKNLFDASYIWSKIEVVLGDSCLRKNDGNLSEQHYAFAEKTQGLWLLLSQERVKLVET